MRPVDELPEWLRTLTDAARSARPEQMSRFLPPTDGSGRRSAVLLAVADTRSGPGILLIQRAPDMRNHANQVAFPGGAHDATDPSLVQTALREAAEEVGLDPGSVEVVAELPDLFLPPSGFVVRPVLAWWHEPHAVSAVDPREVARVAVVPVAALADPANRFRVGHPNGWVGPGFETDGLFIWGFTAGVLDGLIRLGGWFRPWDDTQIRTLPGEVAGRRP